MQLQKLDMDGIAFMWLSLVLEEDSKLRLMQSGSNQVALKLCTRVIRRNASLSKHHPGISLLPKHFFPTPILNNKHKAMAADAQLSPAINGTRNEGAIELALDLPHSPGTRINLHLTVLAKSVLLFLTSTSPDAGQQAAAMGSFVYAMPDVSAESRSASCGD
jgi:hypothetical protein